MLLIKNIEFYETDRDPVQIIRQSGSYEAIQVISDRGGCVVPLSEVRELVYGRRFVRPSDGTDLVVGVSQQAQDVLGLQYEAWQNMSDALDTCQAASAIKSREIEDAKKATLWTRIKWVFNGYS